MLRNIFTTICFSFLFLGVSVAHAQSTNVPDPVEYTVAPEAPGPNQLVYIEAAGVGSFIGNATITWEQNGKVVKSGVGQTDFSFTTGGVGTAAHIKVTIVSSTNGTFTHDFYFAPSIVYLTWEADTSAPLFYKGKSLYTAGSGLKVIAIPFIVSGKTVLPASKLSFQWSLNDSAMTDRSGLGRYVFQFDGDEINDSERVKLDVFYKSSKVGHAEITIPSVNPQVLLYSRDPLRGELIERAVPGNFTLTTNEVTLQAEPYYFANRSVRGGKLGYNWTLNNEDTVGPDSAKGLLTLRQTGQGGGSTLVGISAQNVDSNQLTQQAQQAITITFGQSDSSGSSFLGL